MDPLAILREFGLEIATIFVLCAVIVFLYKKLEKRTQELLDANELRRTEALETQKLLIETMSTFSQSTQLLIDKIVPVQGGRR